MELCDEVKLRIAAFNLCRDHMHILLVCRENEISKIMQRIKGRTAKLCNEYRAQAQQRHKGFKPLESPVSLHKDGSTPFWAQKFYRKQIHSKEQYRNTVNYIENNKVKHELSKHPEMEFIIWQFVSSYEKCFRSL